ncbi:MAG: SufD family Fe-S cluster assembly protein [Candidatus Omnitrophica bacterium]|nr:SufD family Fe-S cluster assembly protein [Candidatus Omnitrophota bacterium]MCM8809051.1 SufD family Fe-S cluster assembly protein [Candidatus Omnitrophota bacterium]MCM8810732.1 SufD family Fe-S cluster assembly protein [Candidatus Omnitrophota bacterium]MCM8832586.1 SufD family Fe-S cluster assembly protein [Candidatus Omnitrophota bacterium]
MEIKKEELKQLEIVGFDIEEKERAGSFIQKDKEVVFTRTFQEGVEILPIEKAFENYPEIKEKYYGYSFKKLNKEFPKDTEGGYFIRVKKGVKTLFPIQACLYIKAKKFRQKIHNIVIVEEDAQVYVITGCTAAKETEDAYHLGITEFFIKKNGFLNFTMIHSWKKDIEVQPLSVSIVEEGGTFISNYISLNPVKKITMYPTTILEGENSKFRSSSIIVSYSESYQDIGARCILSNKNTSTEIISRAISYGGKVIARGHIKADSPMVKGHLECRGLIINEKGFIYAIPELETSYRDVELSHEAAIGKIKREEIEYLASRGIPEEEAQSMIIRGFINVDILGLPEFLEKEIKKIVEKV